MIYAMTIPQFIFVENVKLPKMPNAMDPRKHPKNDPKAIFNKRTAIHIFFFFCFFFDSLALRKLFYKGVTCLLTIEQRVTDSERCQWGILQMSPTTAKWEQSFTNFVENAPGKKIYPKL